ncbi:starch-binding domain-containing protein 1 [Pelobates fuscus]|uniref:starch-binding domain-containing protein 1 n=1 Tax=Pelobates fuscus TaxID=191477 RepID=UPI002FE4C08F
MVQAVKGSQSLSPAAGRPDNTMWAAVVLGILTALFAWLWFGRSGEEEETRTGSPEKQLQPVVEEEEEQVAIAEEGEDTCAGSNVKPQQECVGSKPQELGTSQTLDSQQYVEGESHQELSTTLTVDTQQDGKGSNLQELGTLLTIDPQQDNEGKSQQELSTSLSMDTKQDSEGSILQELGTTLTMDTQQDREGSILQELGTTLTMDTQQDREGSILQELGRSLTMDTQQDGGGKIQPELSKSLSMDTKQDSEGSILQELGTTLTMDTQQVREGKIQQELSTSSSMDTKQDSEERNQQELGTTLTMDTEKNTEGSNLIITVDAHQELGTAHSLNSPLQDNEGTKLQEIITPLPLESLHDRKGSNQQELRIPQTLDSHQEVDVNSLHTPDTPQTSDPQEQNKESKLQEPRASQSLESKEPNEGNKLQEPSTSLSTEPQQEIGKCRLQELSAPLKTESQQESAWSKSQDLHTTIVAQEATGETQSVLENEELGLHPREIQETCHVAGEELDEEVTEYKPERIETAEETQSDLLNSEVLKESPHKEKAMELNGHSITHEKIEVDQYKSAEVSEGGMITDVLTNGLETPIDPCVAMTDGDVCGEVLDHEAIQSANTSEEFRPVELLNIDICKSKGVQEMDNTCIHLSHQQEDSSEIHGLNINDNAVGLGNLSDGDVKPSEADHVKVKKVAAVQPMLQNVNVGFKVHYITHTDSQRIAVTGDHEQLGGWDDYIPLTYEKDGFWSHSVLLPSDTNVEWKFVMVENGKIRRWEECNNRILKTGHDDVNAHLWWAITE